MSYFLYSGKGQFLVLQTSTTHGTNLFCGLWPKLIVGLLSTSFITSHDFSLICYFRIWSFGKTVQRRIKGRAKIQLPIEALLFFSGRYFKKERRQMKYISFALTEYKQKSIFEGFASINLGQKRLQGKFQ